MSITSKERPALPSVPAVGRSAAWGTAWGAVWEWLARPMHYRRVGELGRAAEAGDIERLVPLLDAEAAVVVDSGDVEHPMIRVINGAREAAWFLAYGMAHKRDLTVSLRSVNNQAGLLLTRGAEAVAAVTVDFTGPRISAVWIRLNPELQRHWNQV